jgi:hypothetical protein
VEAAAAFLCSMLASFEEKLSAETGLTFANRSLLFKEERDLFI